MNIELDPSTDLDSLAKSINDQETLERTFLSVQALDPSNPRSKNILKFSEESRTNDLSPVKLSEIIDKGDNIPGAICATYVNLARGTVPVAVSRGNGTIPLPAVNNTASAAAAQTRKTLERIHGKLPANHQDIIVIGVCAVLALIMLIGAGGWKFHGLVFDPNLYKNLPNVLSTLLVVSLFVERVIEVFVSAWSDQEADQHEQNRDYWRSRQAELKNDVSLLVSELNGKNPPSAERLVVINGLLTAKRAAIEDAGEKADAESKALLPFEARTRRISTWIGLVIGMLVSAVGFRFLGQIVSIDPKNPDYDPQYPYFVAADILLTGAVLAGGSKVIHQIFSLYDSFMDATQDKVAKKATSGN
jgi:hypothetical protein